jgi:hypothetical protein
MGEARRREAPNLHHLNGHSRPPSSPTAPVEPGMTAQIQLRLVPNIKIQNAGDSVMLMLGEAMPELGAQMTPAQARQLARALEQHADDLDQRTPRIIIPGGGLYQ